jgi:hypothetical protein
MGQSLGYRLIRVLVVGCAAAVVTAWVVSGPWVIYYQATGWGVFASGDVIYVRTGFAVRNEKEWEDVSGWSIGPGDWRWLPGRLWPGKFSPRNDRWATYFIPMWLGFIPCYVGVPFLFLLKKRPPPPNCCERCHYDLTSNVSGICPECGTLIPEQVDVHGRRSSNHSYVCKRDWWLISVYIVLAIVLFMVVSAILWRSPSLQSTRFGGISAASWVSSLIVYLIVFIVYKRRKKRSAR